VCAQELHAILEDPATSGVPLVVMANKCDLKVPIDSWMRARRPRSPHVGIASPTQTALPREALLKALDLDESVPLYRTSITQDIGYEDALRWLADSIPS
jgi:hypothetical protein